jgi:hypothetical protein
LYGKVCSIGKQLELLFSKISEDQAHVVVLDDLKASALGEYNKVLAFLGVPPHHGLEFKRYNESKEWKSYSLSKLLHWVGELKKRFHIRGGLGIKSAILKKNIRVRQRPPLTMKTQRMLIEYFHSDIRLLEKLLNRNLDHWLHL